MKKYIKPIVKTSVIELANMIAVSDLSIDSTPIDPEDALGKDRDDFFGYGEEW